MKIKQKSRFWRIGYTAILTVFTLYVVLDTFVIPRAYRVVDDTSGSAATVAYSRTDTETAFFNDATEVTSNEQSSAETSTNGTTNATTTASNPTVTSNTYQDGNITIKITEYRENDTTIYVADIQVSDASYLKTAFAESTYGRNIKETTSDIADGVDAILAINGDFYGAQNRGYVIRNGELYRETSGDSDQEDLVVWANGTLSVVTEGEVSAQELLNQGAQQLLSFGPALVENGNVAVSVNDEVDKAMTSNPRTAIGVIDSLHYVMAVSDGRTDASEGLTLYQLASFMEGLGVKTAYNLDGGGSSTMVFNGEIVNNPTTNGNKTSERQVSDIVYIGY